MSLTTYAKGARYPWTNGGSAVGSGAVVVLVSGASGFIGIAVGAIGAGATGDLIIGGPDECVQTLTKHTSEAFTDGQALYWDASNLRLTGSSTGNTRAGRSYGTAASAAATAKVIVNQS